MQEFAWPALTTLATLGLLFATVAYVGYCRGKYAIKAPATTGHEQFERAYRIQMNTLENTVLFLPALWLFALYASTLWSTLLGAAWLAGRVWYGMAYARDPARRGGGYLLSMLAFAALAVGALIGVLGALRN